MSEPLTRAQVERVAKLHTARENTLGQLRCPMDGCVGEWPCPTWRLCAAWWDANVTSRSEG